MLHKAVLFYTIMPIPPVWAHKSTALTPFLALWLKSMSFLFRSNLELSEGIAVSKGWAKEYIIPDMLTKFKILCHSQIISQTCSNLLTALRQLCSNPPIQAQVLNTLLISLICLYSTYPLQGICIVLAHKMSFYSPYYLPS